jgi:hypothetical protein
MNHSFLQNIANVVGPKITSLDVLKKPSLGFQPSRPLFKHEQYLLDCFQALSEIEGLVAQLNYSAVFLTNFRNTTGIKRSKINRFEYMLYHIESYLLRVTGVMDRLLILVSKVLSLNITPLQCKASQMVGGQKGKKGKYVDLIESKIPGLTDALNGVLSHINIFRDDRNSIAHSEKINYADLRQIEMFHLVLNSDHNEDFKNYKSFVKVLTDKKAAEYKNDFLRCNENLGRLLIPVYSLLEEYFFSNYRHLSESESPVSPDVPLRVFERF